MRYHRGVCGVVAATMESIAMAKKQQNDLFPRTTVGGVSVSRMIIGTNWMLGWSHRSPAADKMIKDHHSSPKNVADLLGVFLDEGVDTIMGLFEDKPAMMRGIHLAEERANRKLIMIDTPIINVDDNAKARKEAEARIKLSKKLGATFSITDTAARLEKFSFNPITLTP